MRQTDPPGGKLARAAVRHTLERMTDFDPDGYPPAMPHEPVQKVAPDLFFVGGSFDLNAFMRVSRNMVVVRQGAELTLVNPMRLSPDGEAELEELGTVRHAVRLGCFHGVDDAYTVARFGAEFWCQANSTHHAEPKPDHVLSEGGELPIAGATVLEFQDSKRPECVLRHPAGKGTLLTCDSFQHYGTMERHSLVARIAMPFLGFRKTLLIGPLWLKYMTPQEGTLRPDFERIAGLQFDALISAHGTPMMAGAHDAMRDAIDYAYR